MLAYVMNKSCVCLFFDCSYTCSPFTSWLTLVGNRAWRPSLVAKVSCLGILRLPGIATEKDMFVVWQFSWCSFHRLGSQMCWRCGLRILSSEGSMSANQEKHSDHPAHRSKSCICIFILTWLEHFYSTRRCWGLRPANHCSTSATEHTVTV